jgi:hypothetical protein
MLRRRRGLRVGPLAISKVDGANHRTSGEGVAVAATVHRGPVAFTHPHPGRRQMTPPTQEYRVDGGTPASTSAGDQDAFE